MPELPCLAVTMGDPAGIGPEILVKALAGGGFADTCRTLVIGSARELERACRMCGKVLDIHRLADVEELALIDDGVALLDPLSFDLPEVRLGELSADCGRAAVEFFECAIDLALAGEIPGIVTCPVNKDAIHLAGFEGDIGHQEILARKTGAELTATVLMTEGLRVVHLSTHKPLSEAVRYVKAPIIVEKLALTFESFEKWGMKDPRVAVAALNPHGGEGGLLGREEIEEIAPAVAVAKEQGMNVVGPYPADSIFYRAIRGEFDLVLALYHDQGHIPIKVHNFEDSVTATMGIPFVRTSVDHGTAFDIVGKNLADPGSLVKAASTAVSMITGTFGAA